MRTILNEADTTAVAGALQNALVTLIDLSLDGKQAHWHLRGPEFKGIHEHLDDFDIDVQIAVTDPDVPSATRLRQWAAAALTSKRVP